MKIATLVRLVSIGKLKIISDDDNQCYQSEYQSDPPSDPPQLTQLQTDLDVVLSIQYFSGIDPYT